MREIALHGGVECYIEGCCVGCVGWLMGCVGHFVGFMARMAAHVGVLSVGHGNGRWWGLKRLVWVVVE